MIHGIDNLLQQICAGAHYEPFCQLQVLLEFFHYLSTFSICTYKRFIAAVAALDGLLKRLPPPRKLIHLGPWVFLSLAKTTVFHHLLRHQSDKCPAHMHEARQPVGRRHLKAQIL